VEGHVRVPKVRPRGVRLEHVLLRLERAQRTLRHVRRPVRVGGAILMDAVVVDGDPAGRVGVGDGHLCVREKVTQNQETTCKQTSKMVRFRTIDTTGGGGCFTVLPSNKT
jgi:ribosomal protein S5